MNNFHAVGRIAAEIKLQKNEKGVQHIHQTDPGYSGLSHRGHHDGCGQTDEILQSLLHGQRQKQAE